MVVDNIGITKEQIQYNLELTRDDEEAYLNEMFAYKLKFQGYKYDQLITKLIETLVKVSQKILLCNHYL